MSDGGGCFVHLYRDRGGFDVRISSKEDLPIAPAFFLRLHLELHPFLRPHISGIDDDDALFSSPVDWSQSCWWNDADGFGGGENDVVKGSANEIRNVGVMATHYTVISVFFLALKVRSVI